MTEFTDIKENEEVNSKADISENESVDINTDESSEERENSEEETVEERNVVFEEALEAILFAAGHPVSYATIARVLVMTPSKVKDKVFEYALRYNSPELERGVILLAMRKAVSFAQSSTTCPKYARLSELRRAARFPQPLLKRLR